MENKYQHKWLGRIGRFLSFFSILFILSTLLLRFNSLLVNVYMVVSAVIAMIWLVILMLSAVLIFPLFIDEYRHFIMSIPSKLFDDNASVFLATLNNEYGIYLIIITAVILLLSTIFVFADKGNKKSKHTLIANIVWIIVFVVGVVASYII